MQLFLLALLLTLLCGFTGLPSVGASDSDTVTIALTGEPPTMDPHRVSNFIGAMVWRWSYDTLVSAETGTGKHQPWLATKWESDDNNKTVKFWLRQDATFSDGTPVTSEAMKFTMERVMDSAPQRPYFQSFDHIEILDEHTFIWHNKYADNGLFHRLARLAHAINPKARDADEATTSRTTFGSGPYVLASWTKGNKMVFEANPTWWGNEMYPHRPKTVILRRLPEATTRVKALLTGEEDVAWGVLPQYIAQVENNPKTKIAAVPAVRIMFMGFFSRHGGPLADVRVRKAMNYAIDADLIRRTILGGRADLFGQLLHPWNSSGYNPNKEWYDYNPEKAVALLQEAGYADGFKLELIATNGRYPGDKATCEASAGMLKKVGIDATCNAQRFPLYQKLFQAYKTGKQEGVAAYYMGFGNGGGIPTLAFHGTSACNGAWSGMCFPDLDKAIDEAEAMTDPQAQQAAYEAITDMMKEKVTHKIYFKIHDVMGYSDRLEFTPRHDETLFPWEIALKQ